MEVLDVVHSSGAYFMTEGNNSYRTWEEETPMSCTGSKYDCTVIMVTFAYVVNGIFLLRNLEVWGQFVQVRGVRALSVATQI